MKLFNNSLFENQGALANGLIFLNAVLLAIWAMKETIALRNIALFLGAIGGLIYLFNDWRYGALKKQILSIHSLPFVLSTLLLVWILTHYFIFSLDPISQWQELKSTWLRVLLASILAWATGLVILRRPILINYLWIGILFSPLAVFGQYLPKAYVAHALFAPDYHGYLLGGKINGVMVGTLLIAGLTGTFMDLLRQKQWAQAKSFFLLWLFGITLTLYSYVFIYDTRNGLGLAAILFSLLLVVAFLWTTKHLFKKGITKELILIVLAIATLTMVTSIFTFQQLKHNKGWLTLLEDAKIAVQVDQYPHWQRSNGGGTYPKTDSGREVVGNNYERVAWAVVGVRLIEQHPAGVGVLYAPFNKLLQIDYPGATAYATHSGWIDLGLSFGIPALVLMFGILLSVSVLGITSSGSFQITVPLIAYMIFFLYLVGELNGEHSVEILFYWFAMLAALQLPALDPLRSDTK